MHFKWEDKQLIYMQLRTVPLFLLYLIILIITLNINNFKNLHNTTYICCSLLTYWRSMIIPRTTILKTRSVRKSSQLHVKNEQLSSMNKWVFLLYLFINFSFFSVRKLSFHASCNEDHCHIFVAYNEKWGRFFKLLKNTFKIKNI